MFISQMIDGCCLSETVTRVPRIQLLRPSIKKEENGAQKTAQLSFDRQADTLIDLNE